MTKIMTVTMSMMPMKMMNMFEQPANVDEDAGVGKDDGEEAEGIAACRDNHQCLSATNPIK